MTDKGQYNAHVITFMSLTEFGSCMYIAYTKKFKA